jgi:hypothetical protein
MFGTTFWVPGMLTGSGIFPGGVSFGLRITAEHREIASEWSEIPIVNSVIWMERGKAVISRLAAQVFAVLHACIWTSSCQTH